MTGGKKSDAERTWENRNSKCFGGTFSEAMKISITVRRAGFVRRVRNYVVGNFAQDGRCDRLRNRLQSCLGWGALPHTGVVIPGQWASGGLLVVAR